MADSSLSLSTTRVLFPKIAPWAFQHPLDKQATEQLKKLRGFDKVVAKFIEWGMERFDYVFNVASNIRVGPRQMPRLHNMLREVCTVLDIKEPELYVSQGPVNAFTAGHTNPYIVLYTDLIDMMTDEELMAVIAHEVGHIKCKHVLYKVMARQVGTLVGGSLELVPGVGNLLAAIGQVSLEAALVTWDRRSEYTADRAALLVMQKISPCSTMLMKLAGGTQRLGEELDPTEFLNQAKTYGEDMDKTFGDKFYRFMAGMSKGTHPFIVERTKFLNEWIDSEEYEQILAGIYPREGDLVRNGLCLNGHPVDPGYKFCAHCGAALSFE